MLGKKPTTCAKKRLEGSSWQRCEKETGWEGVPCPRATTQEASCNHPPATFEAWWWENQPYIPHMPGGPGTSLRLSCKGPIFQDQPQSIDGGVPPKLPSLLKGKSCTKNMRKKQLKFNVLQAVSSVQGLCASSCKG